MFDIGWSELVVIGVVALIAIGPKELPGVLRMTGQWIGKVRRMAAEFQGQFQEALREAEMEDLKKQVNEITDSARELTHFDPLEPVKSEIESAKSEFDSSFDAIRVDEPSPTEAADATPEATQPALSVAEPATTIHEPATVEPLPPDSAETRPAATPSAHEAEVDPVPEPPAPKIAAGGHSA